MLEMRVVVENVSITEILQISINKDKKRDR